MDPMISSGTITEEIELLLFGNIRLLLTIHQNLLSRLSEECIDKDGNYRFERVCIGEVIQYFLPYMKL